ncbi:unnamed protein product [Arabis nemorensis]|uniref:TIR domain-containing protein n=1 Tax=Arabis nemorensis TaxID=586526 RepID=A0A565CE26_9BRAS|nr:unnamed protein product [Arabis nemorensis]
MENTNNNNNQVFISFRGKDERYRLLTHLKQKIIDGNVNVFTDDNGTGNPLNNLFEQIRNSRIAIVIFSKNYADVKKQSGKFGRKFKTLQDSLLGKALDKKTRKRVNSRIKRWKKAFKVVTGMIGLSYNRNSSEFDFVMKVVEKVKLILAKIEAEERRNFTQETTKVHSSKILEALSLAGPNREGYIMTIYLKPLSPNLSSYIEEPSGHTTLDPKVPQTGPLPGHRRTVSYYNDSHQYYPLPSKFKL